MFSLNPKSMATGLSSLGIVPSFAEKESSNKFSMNSILDGATTQPSLNKMIPFSFSYRVSKMIGKGSFGRIFQISLKNNPTKLFAAKVIPISSTESDQDSELEKEALIISALSQETGFPRIQEYTVEDDNEILVMSLLGSNISTLHKQCGSKFSLKTTLLLGIQMVKRIESLHKHDFLHRDIKPENFSIGANENEAQTIFLLDFGLSAKYIDENKKHVVFNKKSHIAGTIYYLSVFGHLGIQASRRDDLISLGYMLVHFFKGKLPWIDCKGDLNDKIKKIFQMKSSMNYEILCEGMPQGFQDYFSYVMNLPFFHKPDYEYLAGLFKSMLKQIGECEDGIFDWIDSKKTGIDLRGRKIMQNNLNCYKKEVIFDTLEDLEVLLT